MQINEEEFVDDIKRFVSENVSLSKISDEELAERKAWTCQSYNT